jgi:hypothetical protein
MRDSPTTVVRNAGAINRNLISDALRVGEFLGRIRGRSIKVERQR